MSLILSCFTLACSCTKPPVCQPVLDTCVSMFSSPFQHIYPRTHKEHRKPAGRSCDNNAYDSGAERYGNRGRGRPGLGVVWDCGSYSYRWQAERPPPQTSAGGGKKSIFLPTTILFTHEHALIPIHWLPKAVPLQELQTQWLNKGDWRRADKAREKEFHSL